MRVLGSSFVLNWLHFYNKVSMRCENLLRVEDTTILLEATTGFVPSTAIKGLKIVSPMELKLIQVLVIGKDFNEVINSVPGHVDWIEALGPTVKSGCPEIHPELLRFVHELDGFIGISS